MKDIDCTEGPHEEQEMRFCEEYKDIGLDALIDAFATKMKEKLHKKEKEGRGGWDSGFFVGSGECEKRLIEHIDKCNWVDVANFSAFLWNFED